MLAFITHISNNENIRYKFISFSIIYFKKNLEKKQKISRKMDGLSHILEVISTKFLINQFRLIKYNYHQ